MSFRSIARVLFLLLLSTVIISAQEYPPAGVPAPDDNTLGSLGVQLITQFLTGDFVKRKIQLFFDLIDLKTRLVYVITSFCTTENLIAVKRFLDWLCRLANFVSQFLPNVPTDENPQTALLGLVLNIFNGFTSTAPSTEAPPPVYGPPKTYGVPPKVETNDLEVFVATPDTSMNVKRSPLPKPEPEAEAHDAKVVQTNLSDLSEDEVRRMLRDNEGIVTLSRLISATRR